MLRRTVRSISSGLGVVDRRTANARTRSPLSPTDSTSSSLRSGPSPRLCGAHASFCTSLPLPVIAARSRLRRLRAGCVRFTTKLLHTTPHIGSSHTDHPAVSPRTKSFPLRAGTKTDNATYRMDRDSIASAAASPASRACARISLVISGAKLTNA